MIFKIHSPPHLQKTPQNLHWPFVTEAAFSTNLLPEQRTRSKANLNFSSSRRTVLLRSGEMVLRKAKQEEGARKALNNPQSGFCILFYFTVELPRFFYFLFLVWFVSLFHNSAFAHWCYPGCFIASFHFLEEF